MFGSLVGALQRRNRDYARFAGDEPSRALVREVAPSPLKHHHDTVAESDQEQDVDEQPRQPSQEAGDVQLAELRDSGRAPNRCQRTLVKIMKVFARAASEVGCNLARHVSAL